MHADIKCKCFYCNIISPLMTCSWGSIIYSRMLLYILHIFMKHIGIMLLCFSCITLVWCTRTKPIMPENSPQSQLPQPAATRQIFALWDSITAGYQLPIEQSRPSQLALLLEQSWYTGYTVINAGKSWDTSKQMKDRLAWSIADATSWDIGIITIWWNDWFQGVPVRALAQNLRDIITTMQEKNMIVVIGGMQISTNLWAEYTTAFAEIYPALARETNTSLIPFILTWVATIPTLNLPDMIHPNEAGYKIVAQTVFQHLESNQLIQP